MIQVFKEWEVTQKEFDEKFTYEYLAERLVEREKLDLMVLSDDEETVKKMHFYKSNTGQIYVTSAIIYKNALNLVTRKEISNGSKANHSDAQRLEEHSGS